jgi:hypothetical protein
MPGIGYVRDEISMLLPLWFMIQDAIEGEPAIKCEFGIRAAYYAANTGPYFRRQQSRFYLPQPNPLDKSKENQERYRQYVQRAVYYNFSKRTRDGLVGQVFLRPPVVKKPAELNCLDNNADGKGLQLVQVAKRLTQCALSYGRAGLLSDYPQTVGTPTVKQQQDQGIQPTLIPYYPWQIVNWATKMRGSQRVLSLVVLCETITNEVDDYAVENIIQYRALRLDPNTDTYMVEIHTPVKNSGVTKKSGKANYTISDVTYPKDHEGKAINFIPFTFVGSEANDYEPDQPPMYDLCSLNIAHYRNSADYEESSFMVGQPTPVLSGVTAYWVDNVLGGSINLGSRGSISLPEGADAKLLQASPNTMPLEAMKQKEEQALALGAKLVQSHKTVRTATEVMVDTTSETSTLHNVANNVSAAMEQGLRWACMFVGATVAESTDPGAQDNENDNAGVLQYKLNTEYELTRMNANDRLAVIKIWQAGGIAYPEMRAVLKVDGTATMDDNEAFDLISAEKAAASATSTPIADPFQAVDPNAPENDPQNGPRPAPRPGLPTGPPALPTPIAPPKPIPYAKIRSNARSTSNAA